MLTMRAMDEHGKWLPKARRVYILDENGERIPLLNGDYKTRKERTTDWDDPGNCERWRTAWADTTNHYLERAGADVRLAEIPQLQLMSLNVHQSRVGGKCWRNTFLVQQS